TKAKELYLRAATKESPEAMQELGFLLSSNAKSSEDREAAYMWLLLAGRQYKKDYKKLFYTDYDTTELDQERNRVGALMTADEIAAATRLAAKCFDNSYQNCGSDWWSVVKRFFQ